MDSWIKAIPFFCDGHDRPLLDRVVGLRQSQSVFPAQDEIFRALQLTSFDHVKVVLLGQDPYHGAGQAHGLAFSVPDGVKTPPSLRNIFKEICADIYEGADRAMLTDLSRWANQGVLLLNATLTVAEGKAGSHQHLGWQTLTDQIVATLSAERQQLVFLLWGAHAQKKGILVDRDRHLVLETVHPSPLSAYRGFFGCRHFSRTNAYLKQYANDPIIW
ncbi:MAG: uracil-DNA glycosylase [Gemmatimonadetes bacterium]|nr:uracil-DNA glycosylase [Gemmatimonadota bacterium]MDE0961784.1 uracil-DNA glycosylase [Candidatus Latescibacterota bacterium]MBT5326049.1 uracil-DNA glycosylase [Gemmatimonadota bacterium]MBT5449295.1 uracil-DNA glycosylase [Gemmatimonadota bacterium]MBT5804250.1 uracil-DNA glycosylase [Gemmatimonadota bacterium]